jgi:hypothetical protein
MNTVDRNDGQAAIRVVVEVDGSPVGFVELDIDRLWPIIEHRQHDNIGVEWIEQKRFRQAMRAAVIRQFMSRLQSHLYEAIGNEIVKAELDIENFILKADAAGQAFGRTRQELDSMLRENGRSDADFEAFFWDYMLDDREGIDPKKEWKSRTRS